MITLVQIKIYGKAKYGHRENWKGKYRAVRRDKHGRFQTWKKWSPKDPIGKPQYKEIYIEPKKEKVVEEYKKYEWVEFKVESP